MGQKRRWLVLVGVMTAAHVQAATLQLEVSGAGEVIAQDMGKSAMLPGNLAPVDNVGTPKLIHPGHRIDGAYCHQFGFSFRALNLPGDQTADITVQLTHPLWRLPDGRSGTEEVWTSTLRGNIWGYVGYSFTEAWSLVPGQWRYTITQGGHVLTEQEFQVEVEPGQTWPDQGCAPSIS
jgi:hypothetical protein